MNILICFYLFAAFCGSTVLAQTTDTWTRYTVLDGFQAPPGTVMIAKSRIQCGMFCNGLVTCRSFFFTGGQMPSNCHLHTDVYLNNTGMISLPNVTYYIPANFTVNQTLPTVTLECIPNDNLYHTVVLPDHTSSTFKFHQIFETYGMSADVCASEAAHLVKITTVAKLEMLRFLLLCPNFLPTNPIYFVDGVYNTDAHFFHDGSLATFPSTFWYEFQPSNPGVKDCSVLGESMSWFARSEKCSTTTSTFICEKN